jgi:hypothetical protein
MPLEGLAKAKSQSTQKNSSHRPKDAMVATLEHNWWGWMKTLAESSWSKEFWKHLKTMLNGPLIDKWKMFKKDNLK